MLPQSSLSLLSGSIVPMSIASLELQHGCCGGDHADDHCGGKPLAAVALRFPASAGLPPPTHYVFLRQGRSLPLKMCSDFAVFRTINRIQTHQSPALSLSQNRIPIEPIVFSQAVSFSSSQRWYIRSNLWDAAIPLTKVSLCTRRQIATNYACIAVISCSVKVIFTKLAPD